MHSIVSLSSQMPRSREGGFAYARVVVDRWAPALVIALFLLTGFWYSLTVPPFEAPDEVYHYAFARHLAQGGKLPVQTVEASGPWEHEGTQAPLYYILVGRLTSWIAQDDFEELARRNPYANIGDPLFPGNKNFMLNSALARPLTGANLALHVARWFSLTLGALTLWLVHRIARLAFPGAPHLALAALLLVASIPQLAFNAATCSNDSLVILASTAVVYWLARMLVGQPERAICWWEWLVLGVLFGVAALSKLQALGLAGLIAPAVLWLAWRQRSWRLLAGAGVLVLLPAAVIAGWWYWRNYTLYGEWLGIERLLTINGLRTEPRTWRGFVAEMRGLRYSFWGLFGWFSILLPDWIYRLLDGLSVLALAGVLWKVRGALRASMRIRSLYSERAGHKEAGQPAVHVLLALWAALVIGLLLYWSTFGTSSQGRLLFPAISAFGVLFISGLDAWTGRWPQAQRLLFAALPTGLFLCSVYALTVLLPQSYGGLQPAVVVPTEATAVGASYGDALELVAVETPSGRFGLGDYVPITLYLRAHRAPDRNMPLFVQLLDEERRIMGNVTTHPGWGRHPTTLWEPEVLYADRYLVRIVDEVGLRSPVLAQVYTGFMDEATRQPLVGRMPDGSQATGFVAAVEVDPRDVPARQATGLKPVDATFAGGLRLVGIRIGDGEQEQTVRPGGRLGVTLLWEASEALPADYTAFIHLTDAAGSPVTGLDQPPAEGRFPTSRWLAGDQSLSDFDLEIPADLAPGIYELRVGTYEAASQGAERLAVVAAGLEVRDQSVVLGQVTVR